MSWIPLLLCLVVLLPVQSSALPHVAIEEAAPDVLLLLLLFVTLYVKKPDVYFAAWLIGLARDAFSQTPLGFHAVAYVLVGVVVCRLRGEIFDDHAITRMLLAAAASAAVGAAALAAMVTTYPQVSVSTALRQLALSTVYTTAVCPVVLAVFDLARKLARWQAGRA